MTAVRAWPTREHAGGGICKVVETAHAVFGAESGSLILYEFTCFPMRDELRVVAETPGIFVQVPIWKPRQHEQLFAMLAHSTRLAPDARGLIVDLTADNGKLVLARVTEVIHA